MAGRQQELVIQQKKFLSLFFSISPLDQPIEDETYYHTTHLNAEYIQTHYGKDDEDEWSPKTLLNKEVFLKFWTTKYCIKAT